MYRRFGNTEHSRRLPDGTSFLGYIFGNSNGSFLNLTSHSYHSHIIVTVKLYVVKFYFSILLIFSNTVLKKQSKKSSFLCFALQ